MSSSDRYNLIGFSRASVVSDSYNEEVQTWGSLGEEWAKIFWGRGDERRQAAREEGAQSATFQVLWNELTETIRIKDRIDFEGVWDIVSVAPVGRGEIEFTATRVT